jgi:4-hydroxy-3-polyprenylbenzoate decarboxylase
MDDFSEKVVLAVTGASGSIYAWRTARALLQAGLRLEMILSPAAKMVLRDELSLPAGTSFEEYVQESVESEMPEEAIKVFSHTNIGGPTASGSHQTRGMVIVPCSMKTLAGVANGYSSNLIERSADVTLKENRPLILVTRETPMNLVQLRNQVSAAEAGARVLPASPAFYQKPETFEDLADFIAGRVLNLLGIEHQLFPAWEG